MNRHALLALVPTLLLGGCDSGSEGAAEPADSALEAPVDPQPPEPPAEPPPGMFVAGVTHLYFPMTPGTVRIYEGEDEGQSRRDEVRVLAAPRDISGVACTGTHQEVFLDGELAEVTDEWFAQDVAGNVWKFGEQSVEFDGGGIALTADSWMAGTDGAVPWMAFAAEPRVGDVHFANGLDGPEMLEVVSVTETATVPAGAFAGCLQIVENPDDPDEDIILYAPGVGLVSETSLSGRIDLTTIRPE